MSSAEEAPESYLAILASLPEPHEKDTTDNERPMLTLLDALAGICVSQAEREVYASAIATAPDSCTIFIIGNHEEVPQETQDYLTDICQKLTGIAHLADTSGSRTQSIEDLPLQVRDSIGNVYRSVLLFTFAKFYTRLMKWDAMWTRRLKDITHRLADEADKKKFQDLADALDTLHHLASDFRTGDADLLLEVLEAIAHNWKLRDPETAAFIKRADLLPTSDRTDVPFQVGRYLRKVLKTYNETTKLIRFVVSPRRGHIFRNQPKLVFLRSGKRRVELDIKTAVGTLKRQIDITDEDERFLDRFVDDAGVRFEEQYTCCPHCECAMLAALLQLWKMPQRPAPVVGISKLSCFGCRLYFTAYENALRELPASSLYLFYGNVSTPLNFRRLTCLSCLS
ncbi:hypothetical protein ARMGADRAFT_1065208 [Armillaria gallica]|uniref:Uncharacterized protein n=1 Tax=Armillaria gallica TaxID=47427 RepID=A0A2H3D5L9_ARMGA|nr:hypothetical protein ARMGADRAFT_1065208 [Armillaria gallica]